MKKYISMMLAVIMAVLCLSACGQSSSTDSTENPAQTEQTVTEESTTNPTEEPTDASTGETEEASADKLKIVTTIFPEYDWVRQIAGDQISNMELTMLLDNGVDLHSYQPTADDIMKISDCDIFVYVGGESDEWVEDALKEAVNKDMQVINLLEVLGDSVKTEEMVEGMQETEHDHDHSKEVSTFEDDEVQDRSLSDWAGSWQSAYPFALDGTLDDAFAAMAEEGKMTADEYKTYYQNGYKTDIANIDIDGDHIEFTYEDGKKVGSDYKYVGYYIQNWSTGTKAAMYRFEAEDKESGAPVYIEFNDHMIEPAAAEHFHIRMSNESFDAIVDPENSWPTFFPADMTGEEICEHLEGHDHEHEEEADEHVWLSLKNAQILSNAIASALETADPANKETYAANAASYVEKLAALDEQYQEAVNSASQKTLLFGDRFPFRYLVDDYGLSYYAAFAGCSAESEASFETISFLAKKVDELGLKNVMTIEKSDQKIAKTIIENTKDKNQNILTLDSMQSTTSDDVANGTTYLSVMENNLNVLKEALQ